MNARLLLMVAALGATGPAPLVPSDARYLTADGAVRVVGYNDMDQMLPALAARFRRSHPEVRFAFVLKGTRTAPGALMDGTSAFAPMGAEFEPADLIAWRRTHRQDPVAVPIAHDSLDPNALSSPTAILVNARNPLRRLSLAAIRRIVAPAPGEAPAARWRDVGAHGPFGDLAIRVVGLAPDTAIGSLMLRRLSATTYVTGFDARRQSRDVAAAVADDPNAVGIANLNDIGAGRRALAISVDRDTAVTPNLRGIRSGRYPFDRWLLVYARRGDDGRIEPLARAFLAIALSRAGQTIIASGPRRYLPLNATEVAAARRQLGLPR